MKPLKVRGTRQTIVTRKLDEAGKHIIRVLSCGHEQVETRGSKSKHVTEANCKQCALNIILRDVGQPVFET